MKKISWITPECYIDVDLPIIAKLQDLYQIDWQIIVDSNINNEDLVNGVISDRKNINITFTKQKTRQRSLKTAINYISVIKRARTFNPDFYYISNYQMPWGIPLYWLMLPLKKIVVPCHNVTTPKGASSAGFTRHYTNLWLKMFTNIQVFSKSQYNVLINQYKKKNVLLAPLAIKDYGEPTIICDKNKLDIIRFLTFGIIQDYKRIDLLIEAGNILYERGFRNFRIRIAGNCKVWKEKYEPLIKYSDIFEIDIRRIPNEEVANLFVDSHYFVMPYQDIAQSGAITVAFRYNVPTLVSDIEPFKEFVKDGVSGLTFKSEDAVTLADKMQYIIENHKDLYPSLCKAQSCFVEKELSLHSIVSKYIDYFEKL